MAFLKNGSFAKRGAKSGFNRKLIAPMVLGSILNPINSSIISIALIPIGTAFHALPSQTAWLVSALYLATAIGQPVVGKLIDLYGPKLLFLIATSLVGLSGLLAMFAPNLWWLVGARVLLGFGTCAGYPASMYLIRSEADRTGEKSPAGILTILTVSNQTILLIGPALGGLLIEWGGWQSAFLVNVPLSVACILLGYFRFPKNLRQDQGNHAQAVDFTGIILFAVMLQSVLLFLMNPHLHTLYYMGIAVVFGVLFGLREMRAAQPFIDVRVLGGNAPLLKTYARNLLTSVVTYCFIYGFTQWLEESRSLSPSSAGLLLLPMFVTALAVSSTLGKNPAIRSKLVVGGSVLLATSVLLFAVRDNSPIYLLVGIALLMGIPQGLLNLANQNAVYFQAQPEQIGATSGLFRTSMYIGAILASAANGLFLKSGATTAGVHHLALFCTAIGALLVGLTLFDRSLKKFGKHETRKVRE
ncbi:Predicted arabinose efflux permease, MFS family [Paenibacillus sp. yr247]|uniref:MFS transporter n=1 Tax=Paenibacillus sp. yr247 TaxID=1761880 RepID=UPI000883CEE2|nr:MFS transporter [Paenibacillus sp. yr247]SDO25193.1 Predicted arabinose efflux permease, MFS family [Paenibacillus sp. yr247]